MRKIKKVFRLIASILPFNIMRILIYKLGGMEIGKGVRISRKTKITGNSILGNNVKIKDYCKIDNSILGDGVSISHNVTLRHVLMGSGVTIEPYTILQGNPNNGIEIGNDTYISSHSTLESKASIKIGSHVSIGPNLKIVTHTGHLQAVTESKIGSPDFLISKPVKIDNYVYIGVGTIIQMGVTIGSFSIANAGSIVTKSIPPYSLVQGAPARVVAKVIFVDNKPVIVKL